jgi:hypothetical protein
VFLGYAKRIARASLNPLSTRKIFLSDNVLAKLHTTIYFSFSYAFICFSLKMNLFSIITLQLCVKIILMISCLINDSQNTHLISFGEYQNRHVVYYFLCNTVSWNNQSHLFKNKPQTKIFFYNSILTVYVITS